MKLYDSGDIDDYLAPLQLHALRPRQAKELLMSRGVWSRVSVQEHHYYHFDEVWHAIYNRAERRHLMDPENLDFKDDETKNRRLNLFKSIMVRHHHQLCAWATSHAVGLFLVAGNHRERD